MSAHHVSGSVLGTGCGRPCLFPSEGSPSPASSMEPLPRITPRKKASLDKGKEAWSGAAVSCHCTTAYALQGEEMEAWPQHDLGGSLHGGAGRGSQASRVQH